MRWPKSMTLKLKNGNELKIDFNNVAYNEIQKQFSTVVYISQAFVDAEKDKKLIEFETVER